jgi:hypothetical protein
MFRLDAGLKAGSSTKTVAIAGKLNNRRVIHITFS